MRLFLASHEYSSFYPVREYESSGSAVLGDSEYSIFKAIEPISDPQLEEILIIPNEGGIAHELSRSPRQGGESKVCAHTPDGWQVWVTAMIFDNPVAAEKYARGQTSEFFVPSKPMDRFASWAIDLFVVYFSWSLLKELTMGDLEFTDIELRYLAVAALTIVYFSILDSGYRQTVGKYFLHLHLFKADNEEPLTLSQAVVRSIVKITIGLFPLSLFVPLFHKRWETVQDILTHSRVSKKTFTY